MSNINDYTSNPHFPKQLAESSETFWQKDKPTYVDFYRLSSLATGLIDDYWSEREQIAYVITGAWLSFNFNVNEPIEAALDEIGGSFGSLELPDAHAATQENYITPSTTPEEATRNAWDQLKKLVKDVGNEFPELTDS
ncbi:MAG: hypothetical protein WA843_02430 [Candidatus Saccharimonadales bacterium]